MKTEHTYLRLKVRSIAEFFTIVIGERKIMLYI